MKLFHVTPGRNVPSILHRGLRCEYAAVGQWVWLVDRWRVDWAFQHLSRIRNIPPYAFAAFCVFVDRSWISRRPMKGVFVVNQSIPETALRLVVPVGVGSFGAGRDARNRSTRAHARYRGRVNG